MSKQRSPCSSVRVLQHCTLQDLSSGGPNASTALHLQVYILGPAGYQNASTGRWGGPELRRRGGGSRELTDRGAGGAEGSPARVSRDGRRAPGEGAADGELPAGVADGGRGERRGRWRQRGKSAAWRPDVRRRLRGLVVSISSRLQMDWGRRGGAVINARDL